MKKLLFIMLVCMSVSASAHWGWHYRIWSLGYIYSPVNGGMGGLSFSYEHDYKFCTGHNYYSVRAHWLRNATSNEFHGEVNLTPAYFAQRFYITKSWRFLFTTDIHYKRLQNFYMEGPSSKGYLGPGLGFDIRKAPRKTAVAFNLRLSYNYNISNTQSANHGQLMLSAYFGIDGAHAGHKTRQ